MASRGNGHNNAIGIFDSGIGGLTVLKQVKRLLPHEDVVYFGDTARVPYGTKSKETVIRFSIQNADLLMRMKVKMIVVACNTSSSFSIPALRRRCNIPVVGVVEPGARGAAKVTRSSRVGVIGTNATVSSRIYERALKRIDKDIKVAAASCPLFVPLVEQGWLKTKVTRSVAEYYLRPLKRRNVDTVVLGCTHYPLLKAVIRQVLGRDVSLVDSAVETAKVVKEMVEARDIACKRAGSGRYRFYVSDEPQLFRKVGSRFLGGAIGNIRRVESG